MPIGHSKPTIDAKDIAAVEHVLKSGHLAGGQKVLEFERNMSRYVHVKGAVATNSGTSALHLGLLALSVGEGDEVIIPSYVCAALLHAVLYTGATPKIVDVDPHDFNISAVSAKKQLSRKTKAMIVPHMFGCPANMKELLALGVPIIEDCAQSLGASYKGKKVGSLGVLSVCSFYATKILTTTEGGMVLSNQSKLLDKIRDLREYDNRDDYKLRFNYKMSDVQAALGLSQLSKLPQFISRRKEIARMYDEAWRNLDIDIPSSASDRDHIYFRYVIKINKGYERMSRALKQKKIEVVRPVFKPLHRYLHQHPCPVSDQLMKQCLSIPIYPSLTNMQGRQIVKTILF